MTKQLALLSTANEPSDALRGAEVFKARARALAESVPPKARLACARAFCAAVLHKFWEGVRPRAKRAITAAPVAAAKLSPDGLVLALAFGEAAAALNLEDAGYIVGSTYAAMLPDEMRSGGGVFYTPPTVVSRLLDAATAAGVDWTKCRALDPACGGGAFLGPVARRMLKAMGDCDRRVAIRNLAARLHGYEIDPFSAWMSQVFLDATLNEVLGVAGDDSLSPITVCDSLEKVTALGEFDLVVGNPPYGRVSLGPEQRQAFKRSLYGHANQYGLFLDLAAQKARIGGVVAYVTPTSFLCGEYYKNLRSVLASDAPPFSLDFVSEREGVFDDVLQETLLAVFKRGASRGRTAVNFVEVSQCSTLVTPGGDIALPEQAAQPWIVPRSQGATKIATKLCGLTTRLADWGYRVSTGPLVWNRYKNQMRQRPTARTVPLIWAESVSADGVFGFRAARRNHAPYFELREADDWLIVRRPCVLLQRTTSKEQARRLICAELPQSFIAEHGAVTVENHLNMIVPIQGKKPLIDTATLAAFLNSAAADRAFRCISGTVAVSAFELESMPLPSPVMLTELAELIGSGANPAAIAEACERAYR